MPSEFAWGRRAATVGHRASVESLSMRYFPITVAAVIAVGQLQVAASIAQPGGALNTDQQALLSPARS